MDYMNYLLDEVVTVDRPRAWLYGESYYGSEAARQAKIVGIEHDFNYAVVSTKRPRIQPVFAAGLEIAEPVAATSNYVVEQQKPGLHSAVALVVLESKNKGLFNKTVYKVRVKQLKGFKPETYKRMLKEFA